MSGSDKPGSKDLTRVRRFLEVLAGTQILSAEAIAEIQQAWNPRGDDDSQLLAKELVQREKLTRYQAAAIYQGKTRGLVLNDYVVLDKLGSGGMGNVYKARHRVNGAVVAIKVMSSASTRSADNVKRFQREAEMVARLNHPNIVRAIEAGSADGLHYFAMEFVTGIDLSNYLKQRGPIPYQQAIQCVIQAAQGLDYAHAQGIVHRDIKPGNLFLCENGTVKLLDMGLARLNDPADAATAQAHEGLTQTGQVMGTVDYMAPEQALNTRHADARADIYSLGCTLYRLITGSIPFEGESVVEKILAHRDQPIPSVRAKFPEIPLGVDFALSRMLAKRPTDRYQTMREVVQALQNAPQSTAAPSELPRPAGPMIPSAPPVAIALPIPTAVMPTSESSSSFSLGGSVSPVMREPSSHSSTASSSRGSPMIWGAIAAVVVAIVGAIGYGVWQRPGDVVVQQDMPNGSGEIGKGSTPTVAPPVEQQPTNETKPVEPAKSTASAPNMASQTDVKNDSPQAPPAKTSSEPVPNPAPTTPTPPASTGSTSRPIPPETSTPANADSKTLFINPGSRLDLDAQLGLAQRLRDLGAVVRLFDESLKESFFVKRENIKSPLLGIVSISFSHRPMPLSDPLWSDIRRLPMLYELVIGKQPTFSGNELRDLCRDLPSLVILNVEGSAIGDDDLVELTKLPRLRRLLIGKTRVTDVGLPHLTGCKHLGMLSLSELPITNDGVTKLRSLNQLSVLCLDSTRVDDGLAQINLPSRTYLGYLSLVNTNVSAAVRRTLLQEYPGTSFRRVGAGLSGGKDPFLIQPSIIRPRVAPLSDSQIAVERGVANKFVELAGHVHLEMLSKLDPNYNRDTLPDAPFEITRVGFKGKMPPPEIIDTLKTLRNLQAVDLGKCGVDDAFVERLTAIKTIRALNLTQTSITDQALVYLRTLPQLEVLSLVGTSVTDDAIGQLPTLTNLRWLDLSGTRVASAGLKQVLTGCKYLETLVARGITINEAELAQLPQAEALLLFDLRNTAATPLLWYQLRNSWRSTNLQLATDAWPTGVVPMEMQPRMGATPPKVIPALPSVAKTPATPPPGAAVPITPAPPTKPAVATLPASAKGPPPTDSELAEGLKVVRELYRDDLAKAKQPEDKRAVLKAMLEQIAATKLDLTGKFAMLTEARDLAVEIGEESAIKSVVTTVAATYELNASDWLADALEGATKRTISSAVARKLLQVTLDEFAATNSKGNEADGKRLVELALALARKTQDNQTIKSVVERKKEFDEQVKAREAVSKARAILATTPDDPAANVVVGRHLCLVDREWLKGFAHLTKSTDPDIQEAAKASAADPQEASELVRVADLWWAKAEKPAVLTKFELQFLALYWYEIAQANVTGLTKIKVEKRIADGQPAIRALTPARHSK